MSKHFLELSYQEQEYQIDCANTFLKWTREDLKDVTKAFFKIGFRLHEARQCKYFEALGYPDIETLAEEEFGFKRSTTYGFIQVYENTCTKYGHNTMAEQYIGYDYSKLLELSKVKLARTDILNRIKPTDTVRDIHQYVKYWNEYTSKHSHCPDETLQEWKKKQLQAQPILGLPTPKPSSEETAPTVDVVPAGDRDESPAETVQTFGQPTCAEPEQTETVIEPKKEKPIYNLKARDGVRAFLKDYQNWRKYSQSWGSPFFKAVYGYTFKNGKYIMACERKIFDCIKFNIQSTVIEPIYFLSTENGMAEITKSLFEQYCAEHKDEL